MTTLSTINGIPRPDGTDPKNLVDQFAAFDAVADTRCAPRFFNAAARDLAITTPVEGMMAYLQSEALQMYYDGTAWVVMDQYRLQKLTSNLVVTTTTQVTIPEFTISLKANSTYLVEYNINLLPSPFAGVFNTAVFRLTGPDDSTLNNFFMLPSRTSGASGNTAMQWGTSTTSGENSAITFGNTGSAIYQNGRWFAIVTTVGTPGSLQASLSRSTSVTSVTMAATQSFVRWNKLT